MPQLQVTNIPAPHDGIDLASPPESMSPTRAPWMENFLIGNYGRLPVRGPMVTSLTDTSATKAFAPVALIADPGNGNHYVTRSTGSNAVRPDEIPYKTAAAKANLDTGVTENASGNNVLGSTFFSKGGAASKSVWGFEYSSALNKDTQDAPILAGPRQWKRRLTKLSSGVLTSYTEAQAPSCGIDCEVQNNLLWVLGGYPAAVTTEEFSTSCLFWTGGGDAAVWGGAATYGDLLADGSLKYGSDRDWRNAKNVINRIEIPGSDNGKAIVRLNQNLIIFKERSIWALYGSDDDSYTLRNITSDIGLWDRDSLVEADGGIYFRSQRGIEFFDGSSVAHASENIDPFFNELPVGPWYLFRTSAGIVSRNYIEFRATNNAGRSPFILHRPTRNWTFFTGGSEYTFSAAFRREGELFTAADVTYSTEAIDSTNHHVFSPSPSPANRVNALVFYRAIRPSGHGYTSQFHRAFLDTLASGSYATDDSAADAWRWRGLSSSMEDFSTGAVVPLFDETIKAQLFVQAKSVLPGGTSDYWQGRRNVVDCFVEADDLFFWVTFTSVSAASRAELRGGAIEWSQAAARHTDSSKLVIPR